MYRAHKQCSAVHATMYVLTLTVNLVLLLFVRSLSIFFVVCVQSTDSTVPNPVCKSNWMRAQKELSTCCYALHCFPLNSSDIVFASWHTQFWVSAHLYWLPKWPIDKKWTAKYIIRFRYIAILFMPFFVFCILSPVKCFSMQTTFLLKLFINSFFFKYKPKSAIKWIM